MRRLAQVLVVAVRDPLPRDCVGVDVQLDELLDLGLCGGRCKSHR